MGGSVRSGLVEPFYVMEVAKAAAARQASHGDAIGLHVGQPATPAPVAARAAAAAALGEQTLGYTVTNGIPELRDAIAGEYRRRYGLAVDPAEVIITTGSSAGFLLAALAAFDVGDHVTMARPGYPAYRNALLGLGINVEEVAAGPAERFQLSRALVEALPTPPQGVVVASPSNPTGTILAPQALAELAGWCEENGSQLISDEIYHGISFGRRCASAREFSDEAIVVGSLSKYHSMTGWRVGWLLVPPRLRDAVERLQSNLAICAPAISQVAAVAAFTEPARAELDQHVARYGRNRDLLLERLPQIGLGSFAPPDGAFYLYCDVSALTADSPQWCRDVLAATGVALTPGIDFDPVDGRRTVRLSFCGDTAEIAQALDRLAAYLSR